MHFYDPRKVAVAAAATLCLGLAACGGDDDDTAEPATTADQATSPPTNSAAPPPTTAAPATTAAPPTTADGADVAAFCAAELEVEAAVGSEDPEAIAAAFEAVSAAAPAEVAGSVETAIAEAEKFMADGGDPTPAFTAAYGDMMGFVKSSCGFTDLTVTGVDYAFDGIPSDVPAGPAVITFENGGAEVHEIVVVKIKEGVTESIHELLALPQRQAQRRLDPSVNAGTFAMPGETGYTAVDLTPGRYAALCFVPQGMTPEVIEELETGGTEPEGPPHAMVGMVQEFEVA